LKNLVSLIRLPLLTEDQLTNIVEPTQVVTYPQLYRALAYRFSSKHLYPPSSPQLRHRRYTQLRSALWDEAFANASNCRLCYEFGNNGRTLKRRYVATSPEKYIRTVGSVSTGIMSWYLGIERALLRYGQKMEVGIVTEDYDQPALICSQRSSSAPPRRGRAYAINNRYFSSNDVVGIHLNMPQRTVRFEVNGILVIEYSDLPCATFHFAVAVLTNGNNSGNNQVTCTLLLEDEFEDTPPAPQLQTQPVLAP